MYGQDVEFVMWVGSIGFVFMVIVMILEWVFELK